MPGVKQLGQRLLSPAFIMPLTLLAMSAAGGARVTELAHAAVTNGEKAEAAEPATKAPATAEKPQVAKMQAKDGRPVSRTEYTLTNELKARRLTLDERARELEMRERVIAAAEVRVDEKISQLKQLESRLKAVSDEEKREANKRFASLVSVYETMKAKDAARIFEKLDSDIQVEVATRMKERKMASILAEMSSDAAKSLTMRLASPQGAGDGSEQL